MILILAQYVLVDIQSTVFRLYYHSTITESLRMSSVGDSPMESDSPASYGHQSSSEDEVCQA